MALARAVSKRATFAPNTGGWSITAVRMPGSAMSMPNFWRPLDLSRASRRPVGLPMSLKRCGDFSVVSAPAIGGDHGTSLGLQLRGGQPEALRRGAHEHRSHARADLPV